MEHLKRIYRSNTNLWHAVFIAITLTIGILLIVIANKLPTEETGAKAVVNEIGAVLVATASLTTLWELKGKRVFSREIVSTYRLGVDMEGAGLASTHTDFNNGPDWGEMFDSTTHLDIFVAYASRWRDEQRRRLEQVASNRSATIRVFLADPHNQVLMNTLSSRYGRTPETLVGRIEDAVKFFLDLRRANGASVEIYHYTEDFVVSFYRFDRYAVISLNPRGAKSDVVPTLVCRRSGNLYQYVVREIDDILARSRPAS